MRLNLMRFPNQGIKLNLWINGLRKSSISLKLPNVERKFLVGVAINDA